jgi:hypothetical protein
MSDVRVRPFRRGDRDQLTHLVNAHAEAVVPGMSVSVNTVLGSLERPADPHRARVDQGAFNRRRRRSSGRRWVIPARSPGPARPGPARSARRHRNLGGIGILRPPPGRGRAV